MIARWDRAVALRDRGLHDPAAGGGGRRAEPQVRLVGGDAQQPGRLRMLRPAELRVHRLVHERDTARHPARRDRLHDLRERCCGVDVIVTRVVAPSEQRSVSGGAHIYSPIHLLDLAIDFLVGLVDCALLPNR